jgi:hypothetical protein
MFAPAILLTLSLVHPAAIDQVPSFDIETQCRETAGTAGPTGTYDGCVGDERRARDQLDKQWDHYAGNEKSKCVQLRGPIRSS